MTLKVLVLAASSSAIASVYPMAWRDTPMHTVNMPDRRKHTTISLPKLDPSRIARGHQPHRGGAGTHGDRRLRRLRSRGEQQRAAQAD